MNKLKPYLLPTCGLAVSVVALLLASPPASQAVPSDKDVHVINATFDPVPTAAQGTTTVAGSVSVSNTPTVNLAAGTSVNVGNTPTVNLASGTGVSVTNTPTVNLGSGASVNVSNTAANPVPVSFTTEALEPFQTGTSTTETGTNVSTLTVTTVPFGKRLVIEFVSM